MSTRYPDDFEMLQASIEELDSERILKETKRIFSWLEKNKIELREFFKRLTDKIVLNYDVDEVLLFGSYAKGLETDTSDIDVVLFHQILILIN
ncbi:MAG: hypothetical protein HOA17_07805 [Candidatus Melainabacteria bacterium]|jgi:DNA polymerase sigma|nr:hypothetical protein [Candidatus Melainabacteria bacterium]